MGKVKPFLLGGLAGILLSAGGLVATMSIDNSAISNTWGDINGYGRCLFTNESFINGCEAMYYTPNIGIVVSYKAIFERPFLCEEIIEFLEEKGYFQPGELTPQRIVELNPDLPLTRQNTQYRPKTEGL